MTSRISPLIRPAQPGDLPAILEMLAQDYFSGDPDPVAPEPEHFRALETITAHPDHQLIVGVLEGRVIATLQLSFLPGLSHHGAWRAQIEGVRVHRDLRNAGIGSALLNWVTDQARQRHCHLIQLTTNNLRKDAQRFYTRHGFQATHTGMKRLL